MELQFLLQQAQDLRAKLESFRPLDKATEERIFQKLRLDWNYHSNHLEGSQLTYGETKALILFGITAQGKPLQDHLETTGHDEAILWLEDIVKSHFPLTEVFIRQLHEIILKQPYFKTAITPDGKNTKKQINVGVYKTTPNHVRTVTGELFRFATPEETPALMQDLLTWYTGQIERNDLDPIVFAAEFHYRFIRIHPFDDGNGRMARLLMNFILMQFGYPPAIIKTEDKQNYFAVLRQADAGILEPFVAYIAENVLRSLELMIKGAQGESVEDPDDLDKAIALLEHKLKAAGDKVEKVRSSKTFEGWGRAVLPVILEKFMEMSEKFKVFYLDRSYGYYSDTESPKNGNPWLYVGGINNELLEIVSKAKSILVFTCDHKTFNRSVIPSFDLPTSLEILFEKTYYVIRGGTSGNSITKLYHQIPSPEEFNYIFQAEAQAHLFYIEQKIAESTSEK